MSFVIVTLTDCRLCEIWAGAEEAVDDQKMSQTVLSEVRTEAEEA